MDRFSVVFAQPAGFFGQLPDAALRRKEEVFAVGSPDTTAFGRRIMPAGQELMGVPSLDRDLPQSRGIGFLILEGKAKYGSVRGPTDVCGPTGQSGQTARIAAVTLRQEQLIALR